MNESARWSHAYVYARQNGKGRETENDSVYQKREVVGKRERERNKNVWRGSKVGGVLCWGVAD